MASLSRPQSANSSINEDEYEMITTPTPSECSLSVSKVDESDITDQIMEETASSDSFKVQEMQDYIKKLEQRLSIQKLEEFWGARFNNFQISEVKKEDDSNDSDVKPMDVSEQLLHSCPTPGTACKWKGSDPMDHLVKVHKSITTLQGEDIVFLATNINAPGSVDWVMLQNCFDSNFMLILEKVDIVPPTYQACVQLIGSKKEADRFVYRLELLADKRRMACEARAQSYQDEKDWWPIDMKNVQLFAEDGNLGINVTISRLDTPIMHTSPQ